MKIQGEGHIFKRYDDEMMQLHGLVLEMGELAVSQLSDALQTLRDEDPLRAREVVDNDVRLNQLDIQADDEITRVIAKRQPMAKDLREIIAVAKIVAELERAGDEARKIAGLTMRFFENGSKPPGEEILSDIYNLSAYVSDMLILSMQAFDDLSLDLAADVLEKGLKLDDQLSAILRHLSTFILEDPRNIGHFIHIILGIRALERFGGHATNIAGHIVFIKNGIDVRHTGDEAILRSIREQEI